MKQIGCKSVSYLLGFRAVEAVVFKVLCPPLGLAGVPELLHRGCEAAACRINFNMPRNAQGFFSLGWEEMKLKT